MSCRRQQRTWVPIRDEQILHQTKEVAIGHVGNHGGHGHGPRDAGEEPGDGRVQDDGTPTSTHSQRVPNGRMAKAALAAASEHLVYVARQDRTQGGGAPRPGQPNLRKCQAGRAYTAVSLSASRQTDG